MSIHVTVNGNPVCMRRSRMVLTDWEQIKKNERDLRRRLRFEQVRQQSKEISSKVLERAKNLAKKELTKLQTDAMSGLRKMHNHKITEIQRKYQEDMEDIGLAHSEAAAQPDVEAIIEVDRHINRTVAVERGREAMQRLKESTQVEDPLRLQQDRLRHVREVENVRASMVANLPRKINPDEENEPELESSHEEVTVIENTVERQESLKKKKHKKIQLGKKSPAKVVSKSNVKVVMQQKSKSPRRAVVEVHRTNSKSPKRPISRARKDRNEVTESFAQTNTVCRNASVATSSRPEVVEIHRGNSKSPNSSVSRARKDSNDVAGNSAQTTNTVCRNTSGAPNDVECLKNRCNRESEDQDEPRKTVPTINLTPTKADKVARYNPEDYKQKTSESNGSSSSSVSDDSSYFSDGCGELALPKTTPKHHTSRAGSKVQLYDHSTRQRNAYNQPIGLVERINIRNEPNAEDAARNVVASEIISTNLLETRRLNAQRRGDDAILRERVRRDYEAMTKNLDHLSREERKLKASQNQCCTNEHMSQARRKECQIDRQRKMDRAVENIFRETAPCRSSSRPEILAERIITIPPRDAHERGTNFPEATWQEPPFIERTATDRVTQDNVDEMSQQEHILEMLKKVERQKTLLLRQFGAELPNTIFSASMSSLFERPQTSGRERTAAPQAQSIPAASQIVPSPEIKIINMSSSDDNSKKTKKNEIKKKPKKKAKSPPPVSKTIETAVQTSRMNETGAAKDKSTQVEILPEETNDRAASGPLQYVEPRVHIITPEIAADSSDCSSDSRITGIVIELDKNKVKVTPKKTKRKSDSERSSKRGSSSTSRPRTKPRSLPTSTAGSPVKRTATSAPSSRSGSPKKIETGSSTRSRSPDKIVDIRINRGGSSGQGGSSNRRAKIVVDSSIESSLAHSTPEFHENPASNKLYRQVFKQATVKKVREPRENSDTSTSYASLPAPTRAAMQSARHQITPILEMLDSSANESVRALRMNVSPVSTPETPSPRIMNIPSNIPHPERIGRILRYGSFSNAGPAEDSTLPSSTMNDHSSSTDPSYSRNGERISVATDARAPSTRHSGKSSGYCSCANPTCELMHVKLADIRDYAEKNHHPEVLQKYGDLQTVCTERIASLTELLRRVRNEQQGMDFSITNPADETSLMQLPPARPPRSDLQSVQRLIESIEAIHGQLARTLRESQQIITSTAVPPLQNTGNGNEAPSTSYETKSKGSASTSAEEPVAMAKAKPTIVGIESVQVDLDKLKRGRAPYTTMLVSPENGAWPSMTTPRLHEEIVEKLSQEILEQSKTVNRSRDNEIATSDRDKSLVRQRTPSPPQKKFDNEVTRDESTSPEQKKDEAFVPLLAGIPKIPRPLPNVQPGTRPRPPPAGGIYRSELGSPRHELSTIVEFDTPDTANRSQGSTRSPTGKSRRLLQLQSPAKSTTSDGSSAEKNAKTQTAASTTKPSIHVAPLMTENMARTIPRRITMRDVSSPEQKFVSQSSVDLPDRGTSKYLLSQETSSTPIEFGEFRGHADGAKSSDRLFRCDAERDVRRETDRDSKEEKYETCEEQQLVPLPSSTPNAHSVGNENKVEKITSTSSNSFSGLSGISEIISTPTSDAVKWASSSEEMETALKKMGLSWAIVTLKKTREASALSSSSNSDVTPMNTARRTKSPGKKHSNDGNMGGLPDLSDVSSISIKEASKSTERAVLMKARTSTPNIQNSNSSCGKSSSTTNSSSGISLQDQSDSLTAPNLSLSNKR